MTTLPTRLGLLFRIARGRWADYLSLARYHYRSARPATVCETWRLEAVIPPPPPGAYKGRGEGAAESPNAQGRQNLFDQRHNCRMARHLLWGQALSLSAGRTAAGLSGPRPDAQAGEPVPANGERVAQVENVRQSPGLLWRTGGYPRLAGVVVISMPVLNSAARNQATDGRYCTPADRRAGIALLNAEVRTISRVILHPLYRGLGLASRFVAGVITQLDAPFIESFARMGRYVPFFRHAGMTELRLPGKPAYYWATKDSGRWSVDSGQ